ncbi:hypothetical protein SS50377_26224 [Spironucleus salmonicida]|uniref:Uncharacterized protein n=1 Tax=Spironucleus salmonicida TaxID=348837 RepID=A0A9P8LPY3_9EUKA|nr:hypothetical protein SS50377_26224 [Spironucleus salmonicida]
MIINIIVHFIKPISPFAPADSIGPTPGMKFSKLAPKLAIGLNTALNPDLNLSQPDLNLIYLYCFAVCYSYCGGILFESCNVSGYILFALCNDPEYAISFVNLFAMSNTLPELSLV